MELDRGKEYRQQNLAIGGGNTGIHQLVDSLFDLVQRHPVDEEPSNGESEYAEIIHAHGRRGPQPNPLQPYLAGSGVGEPVINRGAIDPVGRVHEVQRKAPTNDFHGAYVGHGKAVGIH